MSPAPPSPWTAGTPPDVHLDASTPRRLDASTSPPAPTPQARSAARASSYPPPVTSQPSPQAADRTGLVLPASSEFRVSVSAVRTGSGETVLVVLRGNSAAGKSSVAAGLRAGFGRGLAVVGQDNLRRTVLRERDRPGA